MKNRPLRRIRLVRPTPPPPIWGVLTVPPFEDEDELKKLIEEFNSPKTGKLLVLESSVTCRPRIELVGRYRPMLPRRRK